MRLIAEGTHVCGDPGMQFDTTINEWHTCPETDRIHGSNPCSEYMFLNDSACNLASINLMKFVKDDGEFDAVGYKAAIRTLITAQEIIVDNASYPSPAIEKNSHAYRPLGLGYANLGALLMSRGLPYDSDDGPRLRRGAHRADDRRGVRAVGAHRARPRRSVRRLREEPRAVPARDAQAPRRHARRERRATCRPISTRRPRRRGTMRWNSASSIGYRNAQATVLAPTGTIGFMMDCDTTGVEPDIALVKYKKLVGGGMMKIVNQTVPMALKKLGYTPPQVDAIVDYIDEHETIEGAPGLKDAHLPVFDCAFKAAEGPAVDPLHGPHQDDGRHAAVHLRRDQQDGERAEGRDGRRHHAGLHPVVEARREGHLDLPRRQQADAAAEHVEGQVSERDGGAGGGRSSSRSRSAASCRTSATRSRTSSTSRATRATSRSACSRTASRARSSSSWRRKGRRSRASPTRSRRRSPTRSSTACRCRRSSTSSATCASSRAA